MTRKDKALQLKASPFRAGMAMAYKLSNIGFGARDDGVLGEFCSPTASQITDVAPNRWGEPMKRSGARGSDEDLRNSRPEGWGGGHTLLTLEGRGSRL